MTDQVKFLITYRGEEIPIFVKKDNLGQTLKDLCDSKLKPELNSKTVTKVNYNSAAISNEADNMKITLKEMYDNCKNHTPVFVCFEYTVTVDLYRNGNHSTHAKLSALSNVRDVLAELGFAYDDYKAVRALNMKSKMEDVDRLCDLEHLGYNGEGHVEIRLFS